MAWPLPSYSSHLTHHVLAHYVPLSHASATSMLQTSTTSPQSFLQRFHSVSLQIRLSGGRSQHEGRVEVQIGGPGPLRWGLICGDDWGTLEAMVACRQLGLGYANHGLQVSGKERGAEAVVSKPVFWAEG